VKGWSAAFLFVVLGAGALVEAQPAERVAFSRQPLVFGSHVFSWNAFPPCDFLDPSLAEDRIGPFTIETSFYDRNYQPVTAPTDVGRYGAVVTVAASSGTTYRQYRTLYRHAIPALWDPGATVPLIDLPPELAIDPTVADEQRSALAGFVTRQMVKGLTSDPSAGALFAGLHELVPGTNLRNTAYLERDRAWWVGMKRRLYDQQPAAPFDCPIAVYRGRATELTFGSPSEAGMREGVIAAVDSVVRVWQEDASDPISVCLVRGGVVFYYRAFGSVGERPMTLAKATPIGKVTRVMSGLALMTLVDQKRVDLDAPLSRYLAPFGASQVLTVRRLLTHSGDAGVGFGDEVNDLAERVAGWGEYDAVWSEGAGRTGTALLGKVIESVTGEPLHEFYRDRLLDPLECEGTDIFGTFDDAWSRSLDLARFGQLMLNAGSYGDFLFFEPETAQMFLTDEGRDGIGIVSTADEILGSDAYGRDGDTGTMLKVAPQHQLVITINRFAAGSDDARHKRSLFRAITDYLLRQDRKQKG